MNIGRLRVNAEWQDKWHWRPFWERMVEDDPYLQNYYNCLWHVSCGWLGWWVQITWEPR